MYIKTNRDCYQRINEILNKQNQKEILIQVLNEQDLPSTAVFLTPLPF